MSLSRKGLSRLVAGAIVLATLGIAGARAQAQVVDTFEGSGGTAPDLAGWTIDPAVGGVGWKVDGLDGPVGPGPGGAAFAGAGSLNYNDDTDYDNGLLNSGSATSPVMYVTGSPITVTFQCNYETEGPDGTWEFRFMEIVDPGTGLVVAGGSFQVFDTSGTAALNCAASGTWHSHTIDVTAVVGALPTIQVRLRFDSGDDFFNAFDGWFVDNLSVAGVSLSPPSLPLPYSESFDSGGLPAGWAFAATSGTVIWDVDALPTPVGAGPDGAAFSAPSSLNYNDDTDFDDGATNSGTATSPPLDTSGPGTAIVVSFRCNYETEDTGTIFDVREVQVLNGATLAVIATETLGESGDSNPPGTTCSAMGTYHLHTLTFAIGAVPSVRIRFSFDTGDAIANTFDGWFVDDLQVCEDTVAPTTPVNLVPLDGAIVVSPPGVFLDWTDSTDTNPCGAASVANYVVEVDDDPAFGSIDFTASPTVSNATTGVLPAMTYYWRVRAVDASGNVSLDSTATSFTTEAPLSPGFPDSLFVNESTDGAQSGDSGFVDPVVDTRPAFSAIYRDGNTADTAISLRFQVSQDPTFLTLDFDSGTVAIAPPLPKDSRCSDLTVNVVLRRDTVYYWRIQFTDASALTGPFSLSQAFRIGDDFDFGVRRGSSHHGRRCYVATAAFEGPAPAIDTLSNVRGQRLERNGAGQIFSRWYHTGGSTLSKCVSGLGSAGRATARGGLLALAGAVGSQGSMVLLMLAITALSVFGMRRMK
ncbi:MAG: hypothetical protein IT452_16830 [Planctomycetia bacterium]|nr:hypothetical protein [Planctomycetia bacterium]